MTKIKDVAKRSDAGVGTVSRVLNNSGWNIVVGIITGVHLLAIEQYINIHRPIVALDRYLSENIPVVSVNLTNQ